MSKSSIPILLSRRKKFLFLMRILICIGLIIPPAMGAQPASVAQAAAPQAQSLGPASGPVPIIQAAAVNAPNACPATPAGYADVIERPNHCVFYNDDETTDAQATFVADQTDAYWARYAALGFIPPLVTGIKLEVRIKNAGCNGTAWDNYIEVNNGCFNAAFPNNEMMQYVVGHELFHRIQFAYDSDWNPDWADNDWLYEGTARMMEDKTFANIDNWANAAAAQFSYNDEINDYLVNTNRDMTSSNMRYESALFWNYFAEQFGTDPDEPELGVDAIETLWDSVDPADDIAAVNTALGALGAGVDFNEAFRRFTAANWLKDLTGASAMYNYVDEDQVGNPMPYGPIAPNNGGTINSGSPANFSDLINRYGAEYYRATVGNNCKVINATFDNNTASDPAFFHIITEKNGALDYFETSTADDWTRSFFNDGITHMTAIAGSTNGSANVDISFQCLEPVIDVKMPNDGAVANVGPFDGPGKFLAQVLVTDGSPTGPVIDGLSVNDFKAKVNGLNALVTTGGFIQEQYWLVIQAPNQAADGTYNLEVNLEESGTATVIATDVNINSVTYNANNVDHLLVLDRSGSMNSDGKFTAAKNAANFYIDITRNNDGLGVIPYHTDVDPAPYSLRAVTTVPNVRADAENYVDSLTIGNLTSIGDGLAEATTQRNASPTANPLCSFVLLSDGIETADQYWNNIKGDVIATGCPVTTIAFGQSSDETLMQDIATETGGLFFYNDVFVSADGVVAAGVNGTNAINTLAATNLALGDTYEYAQAQGEGRVRLLQEEGVVPETPDEFNFPPDQIHSVYIDETVDEALFSLDWVSMNAPDCDNPKVSTGCFGIDLSLKLIQPDGKAIDPAQVPYTFEDIVSGHVGFRVPNPMTGEWTLIVNSARIYTWQDMPYQVIVSGPSSLTAELLLPDRIGSRYQTGNQVPIHAFISSNQPMTGAVAIADVTAPDGTVTPVRLYDDGQHNDGHPNDGFYAGVYTQVNQAEMVFDQSGEDGGKPARTPLDEGAYRVRLRVTLGELQREALGSFSVQEGADENLNGVPDNWERENGIDSVTSDNDLDGLDAASEYQLGTDPNNSDTDGGGENDGSEFNKGQNPLHPRDDNIDAPEYLKVIPNVGFNEVQYDVRKGYTRLILYRAISPKGPWILQNSELPATGQYEDKAENGQTYYYRYLAINEKEHGSAVIDSVAVTPSEDPFIPEAEILINDGALETSDLNVILSFIEAGHAHIGDDDPERYDDIVEMKVSNRPDMADAEWKSFEAKIDWMLAETKVGQYATVYAQFRDKAGNESIINTASILYVESSVTPTPSVTPTTTVTPTPSVTPDPNVTPTATPTPGPVDVKLDEIPLEFHRRAAQFLEEMRGSPLAPGWDDVMLSDMARALCRPDVEGPAYYEFPVVNPDGSQAGFILLSSGDHDFPIAHWNYEGETPTQNVERVAAENGKKVAKFFKLDTLSYAGEDENGELVAMPGTPLVKVTGLSADLLEKDVEPSDESWKPNKETADDSEAGDIEGTTERSGPQEGPAGMELGGWESWKELKEGYEEHYALFIADLKRTAAEDWEIEELAREFGEGLLKGQTYDVSLLYENVEDVKLTGEGSDAQYVESEVITKEGMPAILHIEVLNSEPGKELELNAEINYGEVSAASLNAGRATVETIKFAIVEPVDPNATPTPDPTNNGGDGSLTPGIYLPFISNADTGNSVLAAAVDGAWSAWTYYWAGNGGDQRLYSQIEKNSAPNTSNCWSGCGGTAWAMLFGWADNQAAEGNSYWSSRWGLYRENGGKGANAVAPVNMDNGVRNMTWEIRNDVDTWCAFGSGPTNPWDMDEASEYFVGRTGTKLDTHYNVLGIHEGRLREYARNSIRDRNTPAIIGTGWLTHYPLAYGYAWRKRTVRKCFIWCWNETEYSRFFYVNQGWGGSGNGWVSAGTWFAGEIRP